jgi:GTP cyclohydrolase II
MQFKKTILRLLLILFPLAGLAQTTYLPQGDKSNILLERLEIKAQNDSVLNFSKTKYFNRSNYAINGVKSYLQQRDIALLSKVDAYNLQRLYLNNTEWLTEEERAQYKSKKPIWKNFFTSPANLYEVHVKDFDLVINPVVQYKRTFRAGKDRQQNWFCRLPYR